MRYLYHVGVAPGVHYDCIAEETLKLKRGDEVVVRCDRYQDYGRVLCCHDDKPVDEDALKKRQSQGPRGRRVQGQRTPVIIRHPNLVDKGKVHESEIRSRSIFRTAQKMVGEHGLDMKLVNCHYSFDRKMVVLQFTAEGRVDFRELVRELSQVLHTRVELSLGGVRDEAGIQGGIGCCGRPFCCATFLRQFVSINVRMAKEQGLSLNPSNISGACGRLKCCLRYEAEGYKELRKQLPKNGVACETPRGRGKVLDCNMLTQHVRVYLEAPDGQVVVFPAEEVKAIPRSPSSDDRPEGGRRDTNGAGSEGRDGPRPRERAEQKAGPRREDGNSGRDGGGRRGSRQDAGPPRPERQTDGPPSPSAKDD